MIPEALKDFGFVAALDAHDGAAITGGTLHRGEASLDVAPERIAETCRFLKDQQEFNRLSAVTAVDWHPIEPRFEVVYLLHSIPRNERVSLKCRLSGEAAEIDSVSGIWRAADWYEREVFDLFGIHFRNHPNLRRLLLPENWQGHPLRKDYETTGSKYTYRGEAL